MAVSPSSPPLAMAPPPVPQSVAGAAMAVWAAKCASTARSVFSHAVRCRPASWPNPWAAAVVMAVSRSLSPAPRPVPAQPRSRPVSVALAARAAPAARLPCAREARSRRPGIFRPGWSRNPSVGVAAMAASLSPWQPRVQAAAVVPFRHRLAVSAGLAVLAGGLMHCSRARYSRRARRPWAACSSRSVAAVAMAGSALPEPEPSDGQPPGRRHSGWVVSAVPVAMAAG